MVCAACEWPEAYFDEHIWFDEWPANLQVKAGQFVSVADIRRVAIPVLRHRISTNFQAQAEGLKTEDIINRLLGEVPEPTVPKYE